MVEEGRVVEMSIPISALPKRLQDQVAAQLYQQPAKPVPMPAKAPVAPKQAKDTPKLCLPFLPPSWQPISEFKFSPDRKWRFDYAWPEFKLALEVEGGVWSQGRHTRGSGFVADMSKYNEATCLGWRILRVQPKDLNTALTAEMIQRVFKHCCTLNP